MSDAVNLRGHALRFRNAPRKIKSAICAASDQQMCSAASTAYRSAERGDEGRSDRQEQPRDPVVEQEGVLGRGVRGEREAPQVGVARLSPRVRGRRRSGRSSPGFRRLAPAWVVQQAISSGSRWRRRAKTLTSGSRSARNGTKQHETTLNHAKRHQNHAKRHARCAARFSSERLP